MTIARTRRARIRSNVFAYANLAPYVFFVLFPFYFMVVTSFKSNAELYNLKSIPFWIQTGAILDHYALLFQKTDFVTWMKNSLLVAVVILFSTIFTFGDFNIVQVLTRGGPINTTHLFATLAYQVGLSGGNLGQGAAISLFIFPLLALVVFFQLQYIRKE